MYSYYADQDIGFLEAACYVAAIYVMLDFLVWAGLGSFNN